jgi:hypothetical protein
MESRIPIVGAANTESQMLGSPPERMAQGRYISADGINEYTY